MAYLRKKIKIELSEGSIDNAIKQLEEFQERIQKNNRTFVKKLASIGKYKIEEVVQDIDPEHSDKSFTVNMTPLDNDNSITITLNGEDVMFIEFSSGFTYGINDYPLPSGEPYGVGTYPGQTHAYDADGWTYWDKNSYTKKHSYGTPAYMPMYKAEEEIARKIIEIAEETFGSGS